MAQEFDDDPPRIYDSEIHREVRKFLRKHKDLEARWPEIEDWVCRSPRRGPRIDHLKGVWLCSYRWDHGSYRIKYEVLDDDLLIHFYDANNRGDVYKGRRGAGRRR